MSSSHEQLAINDVSTSSSPNPDKRLLREIEILRTAHTIIEGDLSGSKTVIETYNKRQFPSEEFRFKTLDKRTWRIVVPHIAMFPETLQSEGLYLNGMSESLTELKDPTMFRESIKRKKNSKFAHDRSLWLFEQNWDLLAGMFYADRVKGEKDLPCFTEVDLNKYDVGVDGNGKQRTAGHADLIGVANHLIIIEFSTSYKKKTTQIERQSNGLSFLWAEHENPLDLIPIASYAAQYSHDGRTSKVVLMPWEVINQNIQHSSSQEERIIFSADANR